MKKHTQNVLTSFVGALLFVPALMLIGSDSFSFTVFLLSKVVGVGLLFIMLLAIAWEAGE